MSFRIEEDTLGQVLVDTSALWRSQTQRSLENFPIGVEKMPKELILAFALLKKACARANLRLQKINGMQEWAIVSVCDEILAGRHDDQFPLSVWQTGSGTQTNMNVNEVISVRGAQLLGEDVLQPNDVVNASQSSNDTFPSALHIFCVLMVQDTLFPAMDHMISVLKDLEAAWPGLIKVGRTHLQDAAPLRFCQEISGWRGMLEADRAQIGAVLPFLEQLAIGATAVGTGLNCPEGFDGLVCSLLSDMTGAAFVPSSNKFTSLSSKNACVFLSGALSALAGDLMKIANDVRWLASGPRCGIGEIRIPENEPGSSIMPGKVNPTQCEAVTMAAVQVMGNDATVSFAGSQGNFQLNVFMPVIAYNLWQSMRLLADVMRSFTDRCLVGLEPAADVMSAHLQDSLMLVTCLNPVIGYKKAALAARTAYANNTSLREAVVNLGLLSGEEFDYWVDPEKMV